MKVLNCSLLTEMCEAVLDGEPVFIIRAQDKLSAEVVDYYLTLAKQEKAKNTGRVTTVLEKIHKWQDANPNRIKLPD